MKSLIAELPKSGSTWAWSQDLKTGSLSLEKRFFPPMTFWAMVSRTSLGLGKLSCPSDPCQDTQSAPGPGNQES